LEKRGRGYRKRMKRVKQSGRESGVVVVVVLTLGSHDVVN